MINKERDDEQYYILVEGLGLERVMGTPGVDGKNTVTNNIIETQKVLGIEAARCTIASEIKYVLIVMLCYTILLCLCNTYIPHAHLANIIYYSLLRMSLYNLLLYIVHFDMHTPVLSHILCLILHICICIGI